MSNKTDITGKTISAFTLYKFVQDITKPFTSFNAYRQGVIDRDGYFTVAPEDVPSSVSTFELFIIYLKRLFDQIPNPSTSSKLKSATSALTLFRECLVDYDLDADYIIEGILDEFDQTELKEQMLAMGGNFQTGQVGEPGNFAGVDPPLFYSVHKKRKKNKHPLSKIARRKAPIGLEGY